VAWAGLVMENLSSLSSHKRPKVLELIEVRSCELLCLLPYSADLNLVEESFAKLKALFCAEQKPEESQGFGGGASLGLSISRQIAGSHGGEIRGRSAPGEGSTFTVLLLHRPNS
jgi:light-regulated signal transduction histidine kinase (bacteriophytochrome)